MSSFRGFLKLLYRKGIKAKDARRILVVQSPEASAGLVRHAIDYALLTRVNLKPPSHAFDAQRVNPSLLNGYGVLQLRGLHASLQSLQMSQPEAEESPSPNGGEVPRSVSTEGNTAAEPADKVEGEDVSNSSNAYQGFNDVAAKKPDTSTTATLAPIVPGMPAVHRGAHVPVVGESLSLRGLMKAMTDRVRRRLFEEAIQIYRDWLKCIDPITGKPNRPEVTPCNIALLAEGLKGASVDLLLKRVDEMGRLGLAPDIDTFYVLFNAAADTSVYDRLFKMVVDLKIPVQEEWCIKAIVGIRSDADIGKAMDYVRIMALNHLSPDDVCVSRLVGAFSRIGQVQKAVDILRWGQKREAYPSMNALGDLLQSCIDQDVSDGALLALDVLFGRRKGKPVRTSSLDEGTLLAVLSLAARTGDLGLSTRAWELLMLSPRQGNFPSEACFLARLHAATSAKNLDLAITTLQSMEKEHPSAINTEVFSPFTSLRPFVLGCARGGSSTLDAAYFELEAMAPGHQVPLSAINCVILGCANVWDIDRAYQTFEAIRGVFGMMPNVHSCNALIDGFAKMRKVPETLKVYEFMIGSGIQPDQRTFDVLIKAHVVNRDTKSAMEIINQMVDAGFSLHKDLALKVRRRFIRECDDQGARRMLDFKQKFKYAEGFSGDGRRAVLFPFAVDIQRAT